MLILRNWIKEILSVFVFLRFRTFWELYEYVAAKKIKKGILASVYDYQAEKRGGYVGINATFGGRPCFPHGIQGVFISEGSVIGKDAVIFQNVTIGAVRTRGSKCIGNPTIGDNCYIGAGAKVIGNVRIGNNCRIGANTVVYEDMPDNSVAVCSPTRVITKDEPLDNRYFVMFDDGERYWDHGVFRKDEAIGVQ